MSATVTAPSPLLAGLTVLERGWLSSNNIVIHGAPGEAGAVLVDTGHVVHAAQTLALVRRALQQPDRAPEPLVRIVNTHLHSDHCGGNALLQREFADVAIVIPPGEAEAVRQWDVARLSHDDFGRRERFTIAGTLAPGEHFVAGGRRWDAHAAPGHDPHSLVLFDAANGVLLSADALWANGFGVIFPELVGDSGFAESGSDAGHDRAAAGALRCARPRRAVHRRGQQAGARPLAAGSLSRRPGAACAPRGEGDREVPRDGGAQRARAELLHWAATAPLVQEVVQRFGRGDEGAASAAQWIDGFVDELLAAGIIGREPGEAVAGMNGTKPRRTSASSTAEPQRSRHSRKPCPRHRPKPSSPSWPRSSASAGAAPPTQRWPRASPPSSTTSSSGWPRATPTCARHRATARPPAFFLEELYGPGDFVQRDAQFARIVPPTVRLFPAEVVDTVAALAKLHAISERFDTAMGAALDEEPGSGSVSPPPTAAPGARRGRRAGPRAADRALAAGGHGAGPPTRSRVLRASLHMMRVPARAARLDALQHFLERGFRRLRRDGGAREFMQQVGERERALAARLFAGDSFAGDSSTGNSATPAK
ncbi:MAG: MBL fold metallo-hydrolase [Rubrivivax sp.]